MAETYGLNLSFRDRVANPVPYLKSSKFLNEFSYYIDRGYVKSLSKTALEVLACGLNVITGKVKLFILLSRISHFTKSM